VVYVDHSELGIRIASIPQVVFRKRDKLYVDIESRCAIANVVLSDCLGQIPFLFGGEGASGVTESPERHSDRAVVMVCY
jgi:hypothetical protein